MACFLNLVAKFLGPSSSAPEGGPFGCLKGILTWRGAGATGACLPMPRPSYDFFDSTPVSEVSDEGGVAGPLAEVGEPPLEEEEEVSSSTLLVSIVTVGIAIESTELNFRGLGRALVVGEDSSLEGEERWSLVLSGDEAERNTELFPVLRQEVAASDLETGGGVLPLGLPREMPPLMTRPGVGGAFM